MRKINGYDEATTITERPRLPIGGYVLKILNAEEITYSWGEVLKIDFDIAEGEHKDFYKNDYESQTQEDKKWKGSFRLNVPKGDGSQQDSWTLKKFKTVITAIEESNGAYRWDWNEDGLKGKTIGGLFNNKEWEMETNNGIKSGTYTNCKMLISVEKIRSNDFTVPNDEYIPENKRLKKAEPISNDFMNIPDNVDEVPFN